MGQNSFSRSRAAIAVYVISFAIGAFNHARDFAASGWRPYSWVPLPLEVFWSSLIVLDTLVAVLLLTGWRRSGLSLAAVVMVSDVAANSYALIAFARPGAAIALALQATFLGFIFGSIAFLWPSKTGTG